MGKDEKKTHDTFHCNQMNGSGLKSRKQWLKENMNQLFFAIFDRS